jgi:hypothetical protein
MTTATEACAVIRAIMEANVPANPDVNGPAIAYRWRGEPGGALPDVPAPFVFTVFGTARSGVIENGGGRGHNRHRCPGEAEILVFIPNDWGEKFGTDLAEHFAGLLRSYRSNGVTIEDATVYPGGPGSEIAVPGIENEASNYIWCACGVRFYFDLTG